ncbi:hypothetical protein BN381_210056 [Candidatus Microthrix parvicella RN1]|uniref:Fido domain-containing protein n=1 Tax=Candidatus Neomicrothrix parvicella RN1 TaxID=1229780 RepID=R4Z278_9ACTN|nr:hypothetical protein BN381_210056 [Candidatus Microthrix parvicella RN1]
MMNQMRCGRERTWSNARCRMWLARPSAYPTLEEQGSALVHSVCTNHVLVDGNKRLALGSLIAFPAVNGHRRTRSDDAGRWVRPASARNPQTRRGVASAG